MMKLILVVDLLGLDNREDGEFGGIEIGLREGDSGDLVIIISGVIEDTLL